MTTMPVIFIGHGSPMNAIEDNEYSRAWKEIAQRIPKPKAIVAISAHWYTGGTRIMNEEDPKTIYDMYGFPKQLYEIKYSPGGNPALAKKVKGLISKETNYDNSWGIDHGTWSVLVHMYPERDIPVFQISIDASAPPQVHYRIGEELRSLREEGVLLFGSGNIVHNLRLIQWNMEDKGFDWAYEFDDYIRENILSSNHESILDYQTLGDKARLAAPIPDHFYPLLYILGASNKGDRVSLYNRKCMMGSLSMTSYLFE